LEFVIKAYFKGDVFMSWTLKYKKGLFFLFSLGFILINGFSQHSAGNAQLLNDIRNIVREELSRQGEVRPEGNLVPLTWDIVKLVIESKRLDEFSNLEYYLSFDFSLVSADRTISGNSGGLIIDHGNTVTRTIIQRTTKGEFIRFDRSQLNNENFRIKFQERTIEFRRNGQTGRFDAAAICGLFTFEGVRPYLCIYLDQRGAVNSQNNTISHQAVSQNHAGFSHVNQIPRFIEGNGSLGRDVVISYIMSKNPVMHRQEVITLVNEYINEARREGINHDIAIAQMCYATGFLRNRQLLISHNYAGLNTESGISVRYGSSHASIQEGVWAHIQHLKGYSSIQRPQREIYNQRYYSLVSSGVLGTVKTLDALFATWSPFNAAVYGNEITGILRELYQLSGGVS